MNRKRLIWFAAGAGVASIVSIFSSQFLFKKSDTHLVMIVQEAGFDREKDWASMTKDEVAQENAVAAGVIRECGIKEFKVISPFQTEFEIDGVTVGEANSILREAYQRRLRLEIIDRSKKLPTGTVSATASIPD
ncbi:MAG TPA: hypothetical protein DF715_00960 [Oceanicaulis sp.]|nr:hypothetical protein [Oceanicaulis sp.]